MGKTAKSIDAQERERDLRENPRSTARRWGWGEQWFFAGDRELDIGEAVQGEGPGSGAVIYPWALDRYQRVLRLRPGTVEVLRRLLKHVWEWDGQAFPSQRLMELECMLSRKAISGHLARLKELGYIRQVDGWQRGADSRVHFDVRGIYAALALCIACDPTSEWSKKYGGPLGQREVREFGFYVDREGKAKAFDLDWQALDALTIRSGEWVEVEPEFT